MKNVFIVLVLVLLLVAVNNTYAQEVGHENVNFIQFYNSEMFQWNYNMFGGLTLNYQNQNSGISFGINQAMRNALLQFPDSDQAYNSYRRKNTTGNILMYGGLAIILSAYIPLYNQILNDNPDTFNRNIGWTIGLSTGGLISTLIGSFVFSSGQENLFNAINMFNRNKVRELKGE